MKTLSFGRVTIAAFIVIIAGHAGAAPTLTLDGARAKFDAALADIKQQEQGAQDAAMAGYLAFVTQARDHLKKKGDLEGYKELAAEVTRFSAERTLPPEGGLAHSLLARAAVATTQKQGRATQMSIQRQSELLTMYTAFLNGLVRAHTTSGNIERAEDVNHELKRVKTELAIVRTEITPMPKPPTKRLLHPKILISEYLRTGAKLWKTDGTPSQMVLNDMNGKKKIGGTAMWLNSKSSGTTTATREIPLPDWAVGQKIKVQAKLALQDIDSSYYSRYAAFEVRACKGDDTLAANRLLHTSKRARGALYLPEFDGPLSGSPSKPVLHVLELTAEETAGADCLRLVATVHRASDRGPHSGLWIEHVRASAIP